MDLIDVIRKDHDDIKALFVRVDNGTGKRREAAFERLRGELVRHEVAEESLVRPLTETYAPNGKRIAHARLAEEADAEQLLKDLEREEMGSDRWERLFDRLHRAVLTHAEKEESVEHPRLRDSVDEADRRRAASAFRAMKKLAPTHPHPKAPNTAAARMTLGPVAALVDRARDAVSKAVPR